MTSSGVTAWSRGTGLARYRALLHLGVTVFSLFPAAVLWFITGWWQASAACVVIMNVLALLRNHAAVLTAFHVLKPISAVLGDEGFAPERMVIAVDSLETLGKTRSIPPEKILILLPHCLQNHDCVHRITFDPENCRRCGACQVGELVDLAREKGVRIAVATGGTLARRHVKESRPLAVIAVACPRDLGQGMLDAWPVPVYGIENSRPCGDCVDTRVDVDAVRKAIESLTR